MLPKHVTVCPEFSPAASTAATWGKETKWYPSETGVVVAHKYTVGVCSRVTATINEASAKVKGLT